MRAHVKYLIKKRKIEMVNEMSSILSNFDLNNTEDTTTCKAGKKYFQLQAALNVSGYALERLKGYYKDISNKDIAADHLNKPFYRSKARELKGRLLSERAEREFMRNNPNTLKD